MNCTGKMDLIARGRLGILSMVKLKKKSLSRGSFRTHGRVIGNKNFFFLALDPRGMIGRIYVECHLTLLHTKYTSFRSCGFREEDF